MGQRRHGVEAGTWWLSPEFVGSAEFSVAFLSMLAGVGLAVPLVLSCLRHLSLGHVPTGCSFGVLGMAIAGVGTWKFYASVRLAHTKFSGSTATLP